MYLASIYVTVGFIFVINWSPILVMVLVYWKVYRIARARAPTSKQRSKMIHELSSKVSSSNVRNTEEIDIQLNLSVSKVNQAFESDDKDLYNGDSSKKSESSKTVNWRGQRSDHELEDIDMASDIRQMPSQNIKKKRENKALRTLTPIFFSMMLSGLPWAIILIIIITCKSCNVPSILTEVSV